MENSRAVIFERLATARSGGKNDGLLVIDLWARTVGWQSYLTFKTHFRDEALRYPDTRNMGLLRGKSALIRSAPQAPSLSLVTEWNGCEKIVFRVWPFVLRLLDGFFTTA